MSKAAARETLKNDDFVQLSEFRSGIAALQPPLVPALNETAISGTEEEEEGDDNKQILPINITVLKGYMQKRIQKLQKKNATNAGMTPTQQAIAQIAASAATALHGSAGGEDSHKKSPSPPVGSAKRGNPSSEVGELNTIVE